VGTRLVKVTGSKSAKTRSSGQRESYSLSNDSSFYSNNTKNANWRYYVQIAVVELRPIYNPNPLFLGVTYDTQRSDIHSKTVFLQRALEILKHQNKGCCRVHIGNFSRGLVDRGGPNRRSYRWRWSEL